MKTVVAYLGGTGAYEGVVGGDLLTTSGELCQSFGLQARSALVSHPGWVETALPRVL